MKRITIKDLAKMASLSTSTVSRALSDHPDISDRTKKRVKELADEYNYSTNLHAQFFRKQHSGLIALILPEIHMFFIPSLIKGINSIIDSSEYSLMIFLTNDELKKEQQLIKQCIGLAVAGVMLSLSRETKNLEHLEALKQTDIKSVIIDRTIEDENFSSVMIDSEDASFTAINHLIENGHTNILGIFGNSSEALSRKRIQGYRKAFESHNLPIINENIVSVNTSRELNYLLPPILTHNKDLTAIYTMSDDLLATAIINVEAKKMSIPEDISIVSISDGAYPYLSYPQITHIKDSGKKMGQVASRMLIEMIMSESAPIPQTQFVKTKLVQLDSVKTLT